MDFLSPIEDALIARLRGRIPGILVEPYPDEPESWEPAHPVGAALVRYSDGAYSVPLEAAAVVQERELMFEVTLALWSLRGKAGEGGLYAFLEAAREALTGFVPPHCTLKMRPVAEEFVGRGGGIRRLWQYAVTFKTATVNIETLEEEPAVLFRKGAAHDTQTDQVTEVP